MDRGSKVGRWRLTRTSVCDGPSSDNMQMSAGKDSVNMRNGTEGGEGKPVTVLLP